MNILYIHQYFKTPEEGGGTRSYWIAKELISQGHNVFLITSRNNMIKDIERETIDGIKVLFLSVNYNQKMSILLRTYSFVKFAFKSAYFSVKLANKIDLVYASSTPITVGFPALILKFFKKKPYIFEVRDLWPEFIIQVGGLKNILIISLLQLFEKIIYKNAIGLVTLSPGMFLGVSKIVPNSKTIMIPNMSKPKVFYPRNKNFALLQQEIKNYEINDEIFRVIYFGSLGIANGLIDLIKIFPKEKKYHLIILGSGSEEQNLKNYIFTNKIKNIFIISSMSMTETSEIVNCCDSSIVTFKQIPILDTNSPNKLFDSFSAGKPILLNSKGWTKELIEYKNCGFHFELDDEFDLLNKINLLKDKDRYKIMSSNSRCLALKEFDKDILTKKIVNFINNTI